MTGFVFAASFAWFIGTLRFNSDGAKFMTPVAAWMMAIAFVCYVDDMFLRLMFRLH